MSVAGHLNITPNEYDVKIRTLIPLYDELIAEAARALRLASRPLKQIVDLGVGTGALTRACLQTAKGARVWGIDMDTTMMQMVPARLGPNSKRVQLVEGNFATVPLPPCDAMVSTYALHHIKNQRDKQKFYGRCYAALQPGGLLISGVCAPATTPQAFKHDLDVWFTHLGHTYGRAKGKKMYESWAQEDFYFPLREEIRMLEKAGFTVEVPWRRSPFAVIAALKLA